MDKRRSRIRNNRKRIKNINWSIILKVTIGLFVVILATFFSILNIGNSHIINNIYINGISVSSLSTEEAKNKLEPILNERLNHDISLTFEDYDTTIQPAEIDCSYDVSSALEEAYGIGRTGNILTNNFRILISLFKKTNIESPLLYNSDKLDNVIDNISVDIPNLVVESTYYISNNDLIFTKGSEGYKLDKDSAKSLITSMIDKELSEATLPFVLTQPEKVSAQKIHDDIFQEPQNASVTQNPYSVSVEKQGIDFAVSIDEAQQLIDNSQENEVIIPLSYTKANITVADLGEDIFGNVIAKSSTKYDSTNYNRATNLGIAANKINGIVIAPGETFSFNKAVGERTSKNGFKEAVIYSDGELDYGIGGGICQISSTLYDAVLRANLEIVERKNHSMTVSYLPIGCDATVSYGSVDFKFKNSRNYPIKIVATVNSGNVLVSICGVSEAYDYTVQIVTDTTQKDNFEVVYEHDSTIPKGSEFIKQTGKYGYKCSTYRLLYKNGNLVSKDLISTDTYKPQKQIVQVNK